jgi:predicted RNA-binding Zn-ribbon protein involved in translation (DUF1610 family)
MSDFGLSDVPDNFPYPCPKCGEYSVVYDGLLVWRSGDRPPRSLARKRVAFSPRSDYERERIYHCQSCGAEYFADVEMKRIPHLFPEGGRGIYKYAAVGGTWMHEYYDPDEHRFKVEVCDPGEGQ